MIKIENIIKIVMLTLFLVPITLMAQENRTDSIYMEQYKKNIRKPRINGVYIPKNLDDVYKELSELSSENALNKFKLGEEDIVAKKLALGLGRWIFVNWNFYEGSRISHYLKTQYGLSHPEDMSEFIIRCFHRHLNNKNIDDKRIADKIIGARLRLLIKKKIISKKNIIDKKIIDKNVIDKNVIESDTKPNNK